jgi:hypothetical protein
LEVDSESFCPDFEWFLRVDFCQRIEDAQWSAIVGVVNTKLQDGTIAVGPGLVMRLKLNDKWVSRPPTAEEDQDVSSGNAG